MGKGCQFGIPPPPPPLKITVISEFPFQMTVQPKPDQPDRFLRACIYISMHIACTIVVKNYNTI